MVLGDNYIIACVLPILVMFGFAVVGLIVYKKKTSPSSLLPTATVRIYTFFANKKTCTFSILTFINVCYLFLMRPLDGDIFPLFLLFLSNLFLLLYFNYKNTEKKYSCLAVHRPC